MFFNLSRTIKFKFLVTLYYIEILNFTAEMNFKRLVSN